MTAPGYDSLHEVAPRGLGGRKVTTRVVLDTRVERAVDKRLATLLGHDNVGAADDVKNGKVSWQREPSLHVGDLGAGKEAADGNEDYLVSTGTVDLVLETYT